MQGLSDAKPVALVDARNVIRSRWPNLDEERFLELTREWGGREEVQLVVVFDGRAPRAPPAIDVDRRMRVVATCAESADDWIVREAERLSHAGRRLRLVSSDRELRRRVAPYVDDVIGGGAFATLLESLERRRPRVD